MPPQQGREAAHKINDKITAKQVRIVGDEIESKVLSIAEALKIADQQNLDLVEISPKA
ncbi:MAG: translation initiation factor IF-3, partial [Rikenellaceae bacterium]